MRELIELSKAIGGTVRLRSVGFLLVSGFIAVAHSHAAGPIQPPAAGKATLARSYGNLPLSFEPNQGQTGSQVKFLSRGNGFGLYLTAQEAVLSLHKPVLAGEPRNQQRSHLALSPDLKESAADPVETEAVQHATDSWDIVRMQLAGANPLARTEGEERLPGTANYFLGNDPAKWHANIPTFTRVRYREVYPGVDLVYYGNQRQLEYDFILAPGARGEAIRLRFEGAKTLKLDAHGNLEVAANNGSIAFHKPEIYQLVRGERTPVEGGFTLLAGKTVGFSLGAYDRSKPLVIDPILAYSSYLGGNDQDYIVALASDSSGAAYVTGLTWSLNFPLTPGALQAVNYATGANQVSTAFVSKFNPSGTALEYSTFLGGDALGQRPHLQGDYGHAIAVDSYGQAYVTGYTFSANFPITANAVQKSNIPANSGLATGFVSKLNSTGTALVYSTFLGGNILDEPFGITVDASGNAYIAGVTFSTTFPVTPGVIQSTNRSAAITGFNDFVTKLNPAGNAFVYSTYLGGSSENGSQLGSLYWENPVVVDKAGNAYVAGFSLSSNFPVTAGAFQTVPHALYTVTVSKLNPTATALIYSTYLGGGTLSFPQGLAVDSLGNAYVAGYTDDTDFPVTPGAFQAKNKATPDANNQTSSDNGFLTKINPTGTKLVYSTYLGGTTGPWGGDDIYGVAVDSAGDAYVTGAAMSSDFPVTANAYQKTNKGATQCCVESTYTTDAFLTEFNPAGNALVYSTYLGGGGRQNANGPGGYGDSALAITLGAGGVVHLAGYASSSNFPVTTGAFQATYNSTQNMGFVSEFDLGPAPTTKDTLTTLTPSARSVVPGTTVTFTAAVAPVSGTAVPTGGVAFSIDEGAPVTVALGATGKAVYSTATLAAGAHYVLASYSGSATYAGSGGGVTEFVVPVTPVFTPPGGTYYSQQNVTISTSTKTGVLHYTLDGVTTPSIFTPTYAAPIQLIQNKTIEAVAVAQSDASSPVVTDAYSIVGSPTVLAEPVLGVASATASPNATLQALVNTHGVAGSYTFQYGTSSSALTLATVAAPLSASTARVQVSARVNGLKSKTTYYYRVLVTTPGGVTAGAVLSFTTE